MTTTVTLRVYRESKEYPNIELKMAQLYRNGYSVTAPFINPWKLGEWNIACDYNRELGQCDSQVTSNPRIAARLLNVATWPAGHLIILSDDDGNITEDKAYCLMCRRDFSKLIEF